MRKNYHLIVRLALALTLPSVYAESDNDYPQILIGTLKKKKSNQGRPNLPEKNPVTLGYTYGNGILTFDFPANSLPASLSVTENASNMTFYNGTILTATPGIEMDLPDGEYQMTLTLVDNQVFTGTITLE